MFVREQKVCLWSDRNWKNLRWKYVATPTVDQYKKLMKDIHSIPRCESIDILNVETRDDIIEADIDIERIGKIYARVTEDI